MKRVTIEFSDAAYKVLDKLEKKHGADKGIILKTALSVFMVVYDEQENGSVIEMANKKKNYRKEMERMVDLLSKDGG